MRQRLRTRQVESTGVVGLILPLPASLSFRGAHAEESRGTFGPRKGAKRRERTRKGKPSITLTTKHLLSLRRSDTLSSPRNHCVSAGTEYVHCVNTLHDL
jgi:hypothetical protein